MSAAFLKINSRDDVPRAISTMQLAGAGHRVPVLQAVYAGRIGTWEAQRTGCAGACKRFLAMVSKPALVIIGDDDDSPTGPDGWPVAQRLLRWARQVIVHGAGGHPAHYEAAVLATELVERLLLIECDTAHVEAWKAAARRWARQAIVVAIQVPAGEAPHPLAIDRADVQ